MTSHRIALHATAVAAMAIAVLAVSATQLDPSRLHVAGLGHSLTDQVEWISVARHLADGGELRSSVIYPATLAQETTRGGLYLPGHYLALAASFKAFGFGTLPALLPSLLGFVIAAVLTFALAQRVLGTGAAWVAALLFVAFPANVLYAFTAKAEMTFVASTVLALWIARLLPPRWRPWLAPFALLIPFFTREPACLLALPIGFWILLGDGSFGLRFGRAAVFSTLAIAVIGMAYASDMSSGRPSLVIGNFYGTSEAHIYNDAFPEVEVTTARLRAKIVERFPGNVERAAKLLDHPGSIQTFSYAAFIATLIAGLALALRRGSSDVPIGAAGLILVMFVLILTIYRVDEYRGLRAILFAWPLGCLVWAEAAGLAARRFGPSRAVRAVAVAVVLAVSFLGVRSVRGPLTELDGVEDDDLAFVESLGHDDSKALVAPFYLALPYAFAHHPVLASFVPANERTLALLLERYDVGTLLLPVARPPRPSAAEVERAGFALVRRVGHRGQSYELYRRPSPGGPAPPASSPGERP